jgi:hypothetical protein
MTKIYTLVNVLGEWMVETKPPTFTNESLAGPIASYVLDAMTGNELLPTAESLTAAIQSQHTPEAKKDQPPHCVWIAASKKSIRAAVNFNGERIAKVELDQDELSECFYVTRFGEPSDEIAGTGVVGLIQGRPEDCRWDNYDGDGLGVFRTIPRAHHPYGPLLRDAGVSNTITINHYPCEA